ncbi:hypothetical protein FACS1894161_2380 [Spirochaetia bacterium]|nr:hypothetical protein FACS1894161_2380 [Spirochaetia bacterium]
MAKIIQFRLPDSKAGGNVDSKTPVRRENQLIDGINFPFDERRAQGGQHRFKKEPIVISVMPDKGFPIGHRDLRPFLQRDGLILLSWARWEDYDGTLIRYYVVNWVTSMGKIRHYASKMTAEKDIESAAPVRSGDKFFYRGIYTRWNYDNLEYVSDGDVSDYLYLAAPFDLNTKTVPDFIPELKAAGVTVDFEYNFSMDREKKIRFAEQYYREKEKENERTMAGY